jgi:hypothetical protein
MTKIRPEKRAIRFRVTALRRGSVRLIGMRGLVGAGRLPPPNLSNRLENDLARAIHVNATLMAFECIRRLVL